jgi:hypothetical protein
MKRCKKRRDALQQADEFAAAVDSAEPVSDDVQDLIAIVQRIVAAGGESSTLAQLPGLALSDDLRTRTLEAVLGGSDPARVDVTPAGNPVQHGGTGAAYSNYGCRCVECTEANRARAERRRAQRKREGPAKDAHGTLSTYANWSCRCVWCRRAAAVAAADRRSSTNAT